MRYSRDANLVLMTQTMPFGGFVSGDLNLFQDGLSTNDLVKGVKRLFLVFRNDPQRHTTHQVTIAWKVGMSKSKRTCFCRVDT